MNKEIINLKERRDYWKIGEDIYLTARGTLIVFLRENGINVHQDDSYFIGLASKFIAAEALRSNRMTTLNTARVISRLGRIHKKLREEAHEKTR